MNIRAATIEDMRGMAQIAYEAWLWAYSGFMPQDEIELHCGPEKRIQRWAETWEDMATRLVAVDDAGRGVGFAIEARTPGFPEAESEIAALYVHPNSAGSGVGRLLVSEMVRVFRSKGSESMAIHTLAQNVIGRSFYEKMGGILGAETEWNGYPSVWYVWRDLSCFGSCT